MSIESPVRWFTRSIRPDSSMPAALRFDLADFAPAIRTRLLIVQPTPFCNIDCSYCYLPNRDATTRMDIATLRRAVERLRDDGLAGRELSVVWHAGEPLAMPRSFYDEAVAVVAETLGDGCRVSHAIQTNATLIDDAWCELFKRHDIRIGVSVDGPAGIHDAHRRTRTGRGTHDRVLRGMALLRAHGIGFHAIAVVTRETFANSRAFIDFFEAQGVGEVGCNFDEIEGLNGISSLAGKESAHATFLAELLTHCTTGDGRLRVRELESAHELIGQPLPRYRWRGESWPDNPQTLPFAMISLACNGDFSTFSPELLGQPSSEFGNFILGNVAHSGYVESTRREPFSRLWNEVLRGNRQCRRTCAHFGFCGGGAPANKFYENGDLASAETLYCRTMVKRPFDAVLRHLESRPPVAMPLAVN